MGREYPSFSVVVPTYNRPERLAVCLAALDHLDYPRDRFEVIVVDDGSARPPDATVAVFRDRLAVALVAAPHAGPAAARNTGAARAAGTHLAFTDDDCAPDPGWLQALAISLVAAPHALVGGRTVNALPDNPYATASQLLVDYLYGYYNTEAGGARFFASNNMALATDRFHALGGFDTTFPLAAGEDREICDRWRAHGWPLVYAPAAIVRHAHALTLRRYWRQHLNYGRGAFYFHRARARRGDGRIRVEPSRFYLEFGRYPWRRVRGPRVVPLATLLVLSQVGNTLGFMQERAAHALADAGRERAEATGSPVRLLAPPRNEER